MSKWMRNAEEGYEMRQIWWIEDQANTNTSRNFVTPGAAAREMKKPKWLDPVIRADVQVRDIGGD